MIRSLARCLARTFRTLAREPAEDWQTKAARYRARGARIGEHVRLIGELDGLNTRLIEIDDYAVIGKASVLLTHDPVGGAKPVKVGRCAYIGYGAIIMPGVTLGDGCVVGAGAVVTKSVEPGMIVAGNPARTLRPLTEAERARIREKLESGGTFAD